MSNLSILRNALKNNADVITMLSYARLEYKVEAAGHRADGNTAFFVAACDDALKCKRKIAKAVDMQRRMKVEIATIHRIERIRAKFFKVFGGYPATPSTTTYEQEAMLDALLAEQKAEAKAKAAETAAQ